VPAVPGLAAVGGLEHARGGDRDQDPLRVVRVDDDRVDARGELSFRRGGAKPVVDARAVASEEVTPARLVVPERAVELEALAPVFAHEQAARDGAHVDPAGCAEGDAPELEQLGVLEARLPRLTGLGGFLAGHHPANVAGALRVGDLGRVLPSLAAVGRARQLGAPVAVTEQGPQSSAVGVAGDVVDAGASVAGERDLPAPLALFDDERALAGPNEDAF